MIRKWLMFFLLAGLAASCGQREQADTMTPAWLRSKGFIQDKAYPEHYTLEHIQLKEAAKRLGFSLNQMMPGTNNPPDSDIRGVMVRDYNMAIVSEARNSKGFIISDSLNNPESPCTVDVWLIPQCRRDFGNGEVLFTNKQTGDAGQFILRQSVAKGGRPITTNNLPVIQGPWRYREDKGFVALRLPSERSSEVQSFLDLAFGPPSEVPLKGRAAVAAYRGSEANGFELTVEKTAEYVEIWIWTK